MQGCVCRGAMFAVMCVLVIRVCSWFVCVRGLCVFLVCVLWCHVFVCSVFVVLVSCGLGLVFEPGQSASSLRFPAAILIECSCLLYLQQFSLSFHV